MKNWPILKKWKKKWENNGLRMDITSEEKIEDRNSWSNFKNIPNLDFVILASRYGVKDFFFFIDPSEIGKEFPVVDQIKLNEELKLYFPNKSVCLRYTKGNSLIASTQDIDTASDILNLKEIFQLKVKVKLATGNLFTSFIISDIEQNISICDFIKTLKIDNEIPVISARRFFRLGNATKSIQITIPGQSLPKEVRIDQLIVKVESYREKPTQCYSCYQFGHIKRKCRIPARCSSCGIEIRKLVEDKEILHDVEKCQIIKCGNCKGNHKTDDPLCVEFIKYVKLIEIRKKLQVPLFEAKRIYYKENKRSYASVTGSQQVLTLNDNGKLDFSKSLKEVQSALKDFKSKQEKDFDKFKEEIRSEIKEEIKKALSEEGKLSHFITRNEFNETVGIINVKIEENIKCVNQQFYIIDQKLNKIIEAQENNSKEKDNFSPEHLPKRKKTQKCERESESLKENESETEVYTEMEDESVSTDEAEYMNVNEEPSDDFVKKKDVPTICMYEVLASKQSLTVEDAEFVTKCWNDQRRKLEEDRVAEGFRCVIDNGFKPFDRSKTDEITLKHKAIYQQWFDCTLAQFGGKHEILDNKLEIIKDFEFSGDC